MGAPHEYVDVSLGDPLAREVQDLENIVVHGGSSRGHASIAGDNFPPQNAFGIGGGGGRPKVEQTRSFARKLLSQTSTRIKTEVQGLASRVGFREPASGINEGGRKMSRLMSSAQVGLRGLRFLDKASGGNDGWKAVEKRFDQFASGGRLPKENFGRCMFHEIQAWRNPRSSPESSLWP